MSPHIDAISIPKVWYFRNILRRKMLSLATHRPLYWLQPGLQWQWIMHTCMVCLLYCTHNVNVLRVLQHTSLAGFAMTHSCTGNSYHNVFILYGLIAKDFSSCWFQLGSVVLLTRPTVSRKLSSTSFMSKSWHVMIIIWKRLFLFWDFAKPIQVPSVHRSRARLGYDSHTRPGQRYPAIIFIHSSMPVLKVKSGLPSPRRSWVVIKL
jgi:hypothetical protein